MTKLKDSDMFVYASFYSSAFYPCFQCKFANQKPIRVLALSTLNRFILIKHLNNLKNSSNKDPISIQTDLSIIQGFFEVDPSSQTITTPDIIHILQPGTKTFSSISLDMNNPFVYKI